MNVHTDVQSHIPHRTGPRQYATSVAKSAVESVILLFVDFFTLFLALAVSVRVADVASMTTARDTVTPWLGSSVPAHFICFLLIAVLLPLWLLASGQYTKRVPLWEQIRITLITVFAGAVCEIALLFLLSHARIDRRGVLIAWLTAAVLLPLVRIAAKAVMMRVGLWTRRTVIVGDEASALIAFEVINDEPLMGYDIKYLAGEHMFSAHASAEETGGAVRRLSMGVDVRGTIESLGDVHVVIACDKLDRQQELMRILAPVYNNVVVMPPLSGLPMVQMEVFHVFGRDVLFLRMRNNLAGWDQRVLKRSFDLVLSLVLLVLLAPLFLFLVLMVKRDGGPAFFADRRIGYDGREFMCLKFRSMVVNADRMLAQLLQKDEALRTEWHNTIKLKNDPRITKIGAFLRKSSIDELPQLLNVIRGDMSLVGPRPILPEEYEKYGKHIAYYFQTRPGITGLWQVSGRNDADYSRRMYYVCWYVRNWSFWQDVVILLKTVRVLLSRVGAY